MKRRFGVHLSTSDGLRFTAAAARGLNIEAVQVMLGEGQSWSPYKFTPESVNEYRKLMYGLATYVHLPYTLNPCLSASSENYKSQKAIYRKFLSLSQSIGALGVVIHPGYKKDLGEEAALKNLLAFFQDSAEALAGIRCLIETDSGSKNGSKVGSADFIADALDKLGRESYGMVVDTEHLFARGVDLFDAEVRKDFLYNFGDYIELVHLNAPDPGVELGSYLDRHQIALSEYPRMTEGFIKDMLAYPAICERKSLVVAEQDVNFVSSLVPALPAGIATEIPAEEAAEDDSPDD